MRPYPLSELKTGMTRLRTKGGASPKALHTLKNGHLNAADVPESRDGLRVDHVLPEGTKGLMSFDGKKVVFGTEMQDLGNSEYQLMLLIHPLDASLQLRDIHFAENHMNAPYVVAEFTNGDVYHYWLHPGETWEADKVHRLGDMVEPTVPNGMVYRATRLLPPYPEWAPNVERTVGDRVEPTEPNNFFYEVVDTGDGPSATAPTTGGTGGPNRSFETGLAGWTVDVATAAGWSTQESESAVDGDYVASYDPVAGGAMDSTIAVDQEYPTSWGTKVYATIRTRFPNDGFGARVRLTIAQYDSADQLVWSATAGSSYGEAPAWGAAENTQVMQQNTAYYKITVIVETDGVNPIELDYLNIVETESS